jgi:EmrB/QacA subfamily drug resistance transporter
MASMNDTLPARTPRQHASGAIFAVVCVAAVIVNLDNTILNVALPTLVDQLDATTDQLQWVVDMYAMVFGGLMLSAGSLADHFGRKRLLLAGLAVFGASSLGAAFSGSITALIIWRAAMGIGAAAIIPAGLATINHISHNPRQRARGLGMWSGAIGLGIAIGPVVGGLLLSRFQWDSIFLINVPISIIGIIGVVLLVPESRSLIVRAADPVGALLSVGGLALILWTVIEGPTLGWTSIDELAAGAAGLSTMVLFVMWERRSSHPMLPLDYFRSARFNTPLIALSLGVFALFGGLFLVTQFLQFDLGYSALGAGLRMLPISAALVVGSMLSRRLAAWAGGKLAVSAALTCVAAGLAQVAAVSTGSSTYLLQLPGLIIIGAGAGLLLPVCTSSVLGAVTKDDAGVGSAVNSTAQQVGGAIGVAVIGSVMSTHYQNTLQVSLAGLTIPADASHAILGSIGGALTIADKIGGTLGAQLAVAARTAFMSGYQLACIVGAAVVLAGVILVLTTLPIQKSVSKGDAD